MFCVLLFCLLVYYLHLCAAIKGAISFSKAWKIVSSRDSYNSDVDAHLMIC